MSLSTAIAIGRLWLGDKLRSAFGEQPRVRYIRGLHQDEWAEHAEPVVSVEIAHVGWQQVVDGAVERQLRLG